MRALLVGESVPVRNPRSVRPWQHVLEPLSGYLILGMKLLQEGPEFAEAWNFGPAERERVTARSIVEKLIELWGSGSWHHEGSTESKSESMMLRLSWEKAATRLRWQPVYTIDEALTEISSWFKAFQDGEDMYSVCLDHLNAFVKRGREKGLPWTK